MDDNTQNNNQSHHSDEQKNIIAEVRHFWSHTVSQRWIILFVVILCTLVAAFHAVQKKPQYSSSIQIKVSGDTDSISSATSVISALGGDVGGMKAQPAAIETALLESPFILGKVIDKLKLDINVSPRRFPIVGKYFANSYEGNGPANALFGMKKYAWGGEKLTVDELHVDSSLINKSMLLIVGKHDNYELFTPKGQKLLSGKVGELLASSAGPNPKVTINISGIVARPGTQFYIKKRNMANAIGSINNFMVIEEAGYKKRQATGILKVAYTAGSPEAVTTFLNTLADTAYEMGVQLQSEKATQTLGFLNQELPKVQSSLLNAETNLTEFQAETGSLDIEDQLNFYLQQMASMQQSLEKLELAKTEMLQNYTAEHPYIITIDKKIKQSQESIDELRHKMMNLPIEDKKSAEFLRDVETKNQMYLILLNRQQELQVLAAGVTSNIKILSYAGEPPIMIVPNKILITILGFMVGVFLSVLYILVRMLTSNNVADPFIIEEQFGLDVKAIVPFSDHQKQIAQEIKEGLPKINKKQSYFLAERYPDDVVVESLRSLRTNIQLNMLGSDSKVVTIYSLTPNAGKTFTSINTACLLSDLNKRVLLVDADLRKGAIKDAIGLDKVSGLSDYLSGKCEFEDIIHTYKENKLSIVPRGKNLPNTADLLASERLETFFAKAREHFDLVVVDSPPILLLTDAILMGQHSDVNLFVLACGQHSMRDIKAGVNLFVRNNIEISGVVMNFNHKTHSYTYSYKYQYGYKYKYGYKQQ